MNGGTAAVLLQAEGGGAGPDLSFFLMMGMIFLIFYLLVMRPQQKQQKARDTAIKAATKGDRIVTHGGLHGVITEVAADSVTVEIARLKGGLRVEVEIARTGLASVTKPGAAAAAAAAIAEKDKGEKDKKGGESA